jgi:hypothetical protein
MSRRVTLHRAKSAAAFGLARKRQQPIKGFATLMPNEMAIPESIYVDWFSLCRNGLRRSLQRFAKAQWLHR